MEQKRIINGLEITYDSGLPYIGFKADWFNDGAGWFFQEHEADNVIEEINAYANNNDVSFWDAATWWSNIYLY